MIRVHLMPSLFLFNFCSNDKNACWMSMSMMPDVHYHSIYKLRYFEPTLRANDKHTRTHTEIKMYNNNNQFLNLQYPDYGDPRKRRKY